MNKKTQAESSDEKTSKEELKKIKLKEKLERERRKTRQRVRMAMHRY